MSGKEDMALSNVDLSNAALRERAVRECPEGPPHKRCPRCDWQAAQYIALRDAARAVQRAADAKLVEVMWQPSVGGYPSGSELAAAIRALGGEWKRGYRVVGDKTIEVEEIMLSRDEFNAFREEAILKALCPYCNSGHVLENGRVWGLCGAWKAINDPADEAEWAATIRSQSPSLKGARND